MKITNFYHLRMMNFTLVVLANLISGFASVRADIILTVEAPGVQASTISGVTTETFNSVGPRQYTRLSRSIGIYTSTAMNVVSADAFGGASQTRYFAIGAQSGATEATLNLAQTASYFGMYWGAGDAQNSLEFYMSGVLVGSISTASLMTHPAILQTGGPRGTGHYGNPNNGQNTGEPYAYLNFFANNGTTFDRIIFKNNGTSTGFETDNHSVRSTVVLPPYSGTTALTITPFGVILVSSVPEPSSIILTAFAATVGFTGVLIRRRSRKPQMR